MDLIEIIGWLGSMLFAFCAWPQTSKVYNEKHAHGLSGWFLAMWLAGEVLCFIYVALQQTLQYPLLANYFINFLMLLVIIYFKLYPHERKT